MGKINEEFAFLGFFQFIYGGIYAMFGWDIEPALMMVSGVIFMLSAMFIGVAFSIKDEARRKPGSKGK